MPDDIIVIKKNVEGQETWRYSGRVLERQAKWLRLEAFFNRPDTPFHGVLLANGDRFIETYYSDRWYNIFEIHDRRTDELKGWYCNVTRPAVIEPGQLSYVDLALDLLVYPDKRMLVLDEDEFARLPLDESTIRQARSSLDELIQLFKI
ncbi:MAG TPA: DUF402 domain-containing protein [Anaerolineaceae bacterium]|nr:DUF402 domain-containing protein [Anaerolineaceae bacterium]